MLLFISKFKLGSSCSIAFLVLDFRIPMLAENKRHVNDWNAVSACLAWLQCMFLQTDRKARIGICFWQILFGISN